jgi:hypothetical protein
LAGVSICIIFVARPTLLNSALAGGISCFSLFVRGNGAVLPLILLLVLLLLFRSLGRAATFLGGVVAAGLLAALLFVASGAPLSRINRSGAGNLAFAVLDETGNWRNRTAYETEYPTLTSLLIRHPLEVAKAAARGAFHVHDQWLLRLFSVFGFFFVPGLLNWLRGASPERLGLAAAYLGLQATYLPNIIFAQDRYFLPSFPLVLLISLYGIRQLPGRLAGAVFGRFAVPVRTLGFAGMLLLSLVSSALWLKATPSATQSDEGLKSAGLWLASHSQRDDLLVSSRLNVAYYAHLRPIHLRSILRSLGSGPIAPDQITQAIKSSGSHWFTWINHHTAIEEPDLLWMESAQSIPGMRLVFRNAEASIWQIR